MVLGSLLRAYLSRSPGQVEADDDHDQGCEFTQRRLALLTQRVAWWEHRVRAWPSRRPDRAAVPPLKVRLVAEWPWGRGGGGVKGLGEGRLPCPCRTTILSI